jgi:cell division protein FtsQ
LTGGEVPAVTGAQGTAGAAAATAAVVPLRRRNRRTRRSFLPSTRGLVAAVVLLAVVVGALVIARETSAFALRSIRIEGADARVAAEARSALAPLVGSSLVSLDRGDAVRRLLALPEIAAVRLDRDFPHTLRVSLRLEHPDAVLRQGDRAWLAATDGRVLSELRRRPYPSLPRVWLQRTVSIEVGATLAGDPAQAVRGAAALAGVRFPVPVRSVEFAGGRLTLKVGAAEAIRLGPPSELPLKLAVAARIARLAPNARYIDVSVPSRSVASLNSQAAG